ncbi:uncharacterized protein LOC127738214 isoform X1 [Mytilus californianus]|uniref:uncharacterized protein LOC127738214 isoform X1 n=2 Tax=Mytilus californianus TaxID=6549 RepID=UPI0022458F24|nr:uncharacterized protein LOC127738214 isoform X1 [Mytilus californianus]
MIRHMCHSGLSRGIIIYTLITTCLHVYLIHSFFDRFLNSSYSLFTIVCKAMDVSVCDYSVEYDILYDKERRDCHFNDERKSVVDLYTPEISGEHQEVPVVLFVHGGGWRRGDKAAWKYYLSRDINLLAAIIYGIFGLYGNVGKALARRGIACAVMSYPLTKLSTAWLLFELTTSYISSLAVLVALFGILAAIVWPIGSILSWKFVAGPIQPSTIVLAVTFVTNMFILTIISVQYRYHKLSRFQVVLIWTVLIVFTLSGQKEYFLNFATVVTFLIGQVILLNTNLQVQHLNLDQQVEAVVKCIKKIQNIGNQTRKFNPTDMFLMGHSAGGHLCSIAALHDYNFIKQGISKADIKGVITISAVLQISLMNTTFTRPLYLHPTFGNKPDGWLKRCPSQSLIENTEYIPPFLIVTAERDINLIKDGAVDFNRQSNQLNEGMSDHVIFPGTNHTSIICNFDKTVKNLNLADLCSNFIKNSVI